MKITIYGSIAISLMCMLVTDSLAVKRMADNLERQSSSGARNASKSPCLQGTRKRPVDELGRGSSTDSENRSKLSRFQELVLTAELTLPADSDWPVRTFSQQSVDVHTRSTEIKDLTPQHESTELPAHCELLFALYHAQQNGVEYILDESERAIFHALSPKIQQTFADTVRNCQEFDAMDIE